MPFTSNTPSVSVRNVSPSLHQRELERTPLLELLVLLGVPRRAARVASQQPLARLLVSDNPHVGARARAAAELARRLASADDVRVRLASPYAIAAYVAPQLTHLLFERFVVLSLDPRNTLLALDTVAEGSLDSCTVDPRLVFDAALRAGAAGIVLVHNHPSGSAEPSTPDIATSRRLAQVGKALSVRVLDSIVVAGHAYVSLAERNLLEGSSVAALG